MAQRAAGQLDAADFPLNSVQYSTRASPTHAEQESLNRLSWQLYVQINALLYLLFS